MATDSSSGAQQYPEKIPSMCVMPWLLTGHCLEVAAALRAERRASKLDPRIPDSWWQTTMDTMIMMGEREVDILDLDPLAVARAVIGSINSERETPRHN
jgi:hypothetical protein